MADLFALLQDLAGRQPDLPRDLSKLLPNGKRHPNDRPLGILKDRGDPSALVVVAGEERARLGNCTTPEVTFSCAKSYLSTLAGLAIRDGLIKDLDQPVRECLPDDDGFFSEQNRAITWRHLLQQTSEWEGELFGLPDWLDRGRQVGGGSASGASGGDGTVGGNASGHRTLGPPGSFWEYNDVRVNRLSLALLRLFQEPLPDVFAREIMDPIGASNTWSWHGYETSRVKIGTREIESVSGGTHWGGGLWISTEDHAKFGTLYLSEGRVGTRQILPPGWVAETVTPCALNKGYGLLFWLNADHALSDVAGPNAFAARGAGGHTVFIWPEAETVITLRWMPDAKPVIDAVLGELSF